MTDRQHDSDSCRIRSPLQAAAILLAIYVTLSLAIGGVIHVLTVREEAIATAPPGALVAAATGTATVSTPARGPSGSRASGLHAQADDLTVRFRECGPQARDELSCIHD